MTNPIIFDRQLIRKRRDRAVAKESDNFLLAEMAERLCERLEDFTRSFDMALDLGAHHGVLSQVLNGRGGIKTLVQSDLSFAMLGQTQGLRVVADEEFLPFAPESFDLILSAGSLHWVNDLPGALVQIYRALKKNGLFMAMIPGGESLKELRESLEKAEAVATGGISPRVSPFIDVRDAGSLLQRAGFSMPVADLETLTVYYEHPLTLLQDLRDFGESNALLSRIKNVTRRSVLFGAMQYYEEHFVNEDGRVPATFDLVGLTGFK